MNVRCSRKLLLIKGEQAPVLVGPYIARQLYAVVAFDPVDESLERQTDELGADLGNGHGDSVLGEDVAVDLHRQWFAVDQDAVAIEDDVLEHKDG